ncbi:probable glutathione S-transferase 7 [Paramacrobiotus metropolitanus]|uniref:probable glutathione S-transferase 7 n=1 Tax=Paramacrobiotus metropolitanus TaxID=2943436 RepID=UPI002445B3B5|nr:probable glutathione S-transferase 7 [Paramacrobiotus metropolitanus]
MPSRIKLAFFNVHHISAEISRWILHYAGQQFDDFRIEFAQWPSVKPTTPEGTVPYMEIATHDKDLKVLSQSMAIARYLARMFKVAGKDSWQEGEADSIVDYMWDAAAEYEAWIDARMAKKTTQADEIKEKYRSATLPRYVRDFEWKLADNQGNGYLVGDAPTWADFAVVSFLDEMIALYGVNVLDGYSGLLALVERVHNLQGIKEYLAARPGRHVCDL